MTHLKKAGKHPWIFDGRNLAWTRTNIPEIRTQVDMDQEQGRQPHPIKGRDVVYIIIRKTTVIRLDALRAYLLGKMGWDDHVLECMNFLDHVMREWPAKHMVAIKRNLYPKNGYDQTLLDNQRWLIAIKGIYSSIRTNSSIRDGGYGLGVNVDIANTAFWSPDQNSIAHLVYLFLRSSHREFRNHEDWKIAEELKPERVTDGEREGWGKPSIFKTLEKLKRLTFRVKHRGKMNDSKKYTIKGFTWNLNKWPQGANARNVTFDKKNVTTGATETMTIDKYFRAKYDIRLQSWQLPCIETTRDGVFPMEVAVLDTHQKYNYKLDGDQTSAMIKFAVTRPAQRAQDIMSCVKTLRWNEDPYLKEYGIQITNQMAAVQARVIANPNIQFGKGIKNPGVSGRWDLRQQVFTKPNPRPLKAWGVIIIDKCVDNATAANFIATFVRTYKGHGGRIETPTPPIKHLQMMRSTNTGEALKELYNQVGMQFKASPDLMFVILPNKEMIPYERLKKSLDIRFATLSQMVQSSHVKKAQDQYCTNVAMKVNAKLGGYTSKLVGKTPIFGAAATMMIGVDISHGQHGSALQHLPQASVAGVTMSMDKDCVQYAACCQTNGYRVEVLNRDCVQKTVGPLIRQWCAINQRAPQHVFYFRDGVSEGEFETVLEQEIDELRNMFLQNARGAKPKITVIIGTKRHHIRFFPVGQADGDRNGNPLPGTILETEVTHPFHYDFYLCSHFALQGTARPVHYHVILDEINMPVDLLQTMIYHQSYQYMRSTTPVSLHPAIYYAHLAAGRARAHEDITASAKDPRNLAEQQRMPLAKHNAPAPSSKLPTTAPDLIPVGDKEAGARDDNINFFRSTMWYI